MSPTSYQTAPPRSSIIATGQNAVKLCAITLPPSLVHLAVSVFLQPCKNGGIRLKMAASKKNNRPDRHPSFSSLTQAELLHIIRRARRSTACRRKTSPPPEKRQSTLSPERTSVPPRSNPTERFLTRYRLSWKNPCAWK